MATAGGLVEELMVRVARVDYRGVRNDPTVVQRALDRLDSCDAPGRHPNRRRHPRSQYRATDLILELAGPDGEWTAQAGWPRNISDGGLGALVDRFVHPGTRCRAHLRSHHGQLLCLASRVTRSRYLEGTGLLHELGLRFEQAVHAALFCREARSARLLLVDPDADSELLVARNAAGSNVKLTSVRTARGAVERAEQEEFDLVLTEIELLDGGGLDLAFHLRTNGFAGPILVTSAAPPEQIDPDWLQAGCNAYVPKPLTDKLLAETLERFRPDCLVSSHLDNPQLLPLISRFVSGLAEQVWRLELAFCRGDAAQLTRITRRLKASGHTYGFEPITSAAAALEQAVVSDGVAHPVATDVSSAAAAVATDPRVGRNGGAPESDGVAHRFSGGGPESAILVRDRLNELARWCLAAQPAADTAGWEPA